MLSNVNEKGKVWKGGGGQMSHIHSQFGRWQCECSANFWVNVCRSKGGLDGNVNVRQSFCKFFTFDTQKLVQIKKMHVKWHAQVRSWHELWLVKERNTCQLTC